MRKIFTALMCSVIIVAGINYKAIADYAATAGSGLLFRAFDATHGGTSLCAAANTQCATVGLINSAGAEITKAGNTAAVADPAVVVSDPNVLAAAQAGTQLFATTGTPTSGIYVAGRAQSAEATAATSGNMAAPAYTLTGKQINLPYANPENTEYGNPAAITDTAQHTIFAAAAGSLRHNVTDCLVTNSHATVGTVVLLQDGNTTVAQGYAAANGGGFTFAPPVPRRGTAATAFNAQANTNGSSIIVSCGGYQGT